MYTPQQIHSILNEDCLLNGPSFEIKYIVTDSRRITVAIESLFFAIKTQVNDGSFYISALYQQGVRNFVVHKNFVIDSYNDCNFYFVTDTLLALQYLAGSHRLQFHYPVIGITGSNGKTIIKEWLYEILSNDFKLVRSPRSYNSQIGVPLSVWQMSIEDNLAIFEAGISTVGEMENLQKIIRPDIGIFTGLGGAHDNGFDSRQQKLEEKFKLFEGVKTLFVYVEDKLIKSYLEKRNDIIQFKIGKNKGCDFEIIKINKGSFDVEIMSIYKGVSRKITIPFVDDASIQNAIMCWAVALYFNIDEKLIQLKMSQLSAIDMRLQVLPAINNCTIINDSYSLDIESLSVGLDLLNQQLMEKVVILSELQNEAQDSYQNIIQVLKHKRVDRIIVIGKKWRQYQENLLSVIAKVELFNSTDDFLHQFQAKSFKHEAILLKGARVFLFENILQLLIEKVHQTRLEINLSNIVHNLKEYRKKLLPTTKVMAMVKAFAYGSGSVEIASLLQYHNIDYLAVAYADEGVELRNAGISVPIMVMNADEYGFEAILQNGLEPEIYSFLILKKFAAFLDKQGILNYPIHLKIDTGMHRLGFELEQMNELILELKMSSRFIVKSVFSHLVSSEDPNDDSFTLQQAVIFKECCSQLAKVIPYSFIRHLSNSAAIVRHPDLQFDMVRLGVGLYGINTTSELMDLRTVATLKSTIAQIKHLQPGETVGYNRNGKILRPTLTATIRIGYADGYSRKYGNSIGSVIINHQKAPVLGNVCMDMTMVDITNIANVKEGDEVEIFGEQIPVTDLAKWADTNSYEIFTSIGQRVKRIYIED